MNSGEYRVVLDRYLKTQTMLLSPEASTSTKNPALVVTVSPDNSTYTLGETVTSIIITNQAAEGTLTILPPSGAAIVRNYRFTSAVNFTTSLPLDSTSPAGKWTVAFLADDYCGYHPSVAPAHFDVVTPIIVTKTITETTTTTYTTSSASISFQGRRRVFLRLSAGTPQEAGMT